MSDRQPVPVAELQRRLDMMAAQGIKTGPMLDRAVYFGDMANDIGKHLRGTYS